MLAIDQVLISDEILEARFVCDLSRCHGGCCVEGDAGAPLSAGEARMLEEIYERVAPYLSEKSRREIARQGTSVPDPDADRATPLIDGGVCVYGVMENGIVKCGIEKAWQEGKVAFRKPVSCHLYPIVVEAREGYEAMNYEPREDLCRPACVLGKKLKVPVFRFLKEALERKYGPEFYQALEAYAAQRGAEDRS